MKRIFDCVVSLLALIILSPIIVITAMIVRVFIGNPIIFKQQRPGLFSKPIYVYKFRTMTNQTNDEGELLPDQLRLKKAGIIIRKLSLDELPQLINVIKGDLSLVGPRPLLMEYLPLYNTKQLKRHEVRPGITGWAQINGRNAIGWTEKFDLDVWYVENQSFLLDIKILLLTVKKVLLSKDISSDTSVTMEKFTGNN